jgi:hypothetical protein
MKERLITTIFVLSALLFVTYVGADVPGMISYQARLTDPAGNLPSDGTYSITFRIYPEESGGTPLWMETQEVNVKDGLFSVLLGKNSPIPSDVFSEPNRWLGVQIGDDPEMTPRHRIATVGYAFNADTVDGKHATDLGDSHSLDAADGDPTDAVYVDTEGNVGIGTTKPQERLDVNGNIHASGGIKSGNSIEIQGTGTNRNTIYYQDDNHGLPSDWNLWFRGGTEAAPGESYILFQNGLAVQDKGVAITMNESRNRNRLWISAYDDVYGNLIYTEDPKEKGGQGFGIAGGSHMAPFDRLVVNSDEMYLGYCLRPGDGANDSGGDGVGNLYVRGNVGIGTTEPKQKLTVTGVIESTSGGFKFPDGTIQSTAVSAGNNLTRKVYEGTIDVSQDGDIVVEDFGAKYHYKQVEIPEMEIDDFPMINVYVRLVKGDMYGTLPTNISWVQPIADDDLVGGDLLYTIDNGNVYLLYKYEEDEYESIFFSEYKIVIIK